MLRPALLALALAVPLAFGGAPAWAWTTAAALLGMLLLGWGLAAAAGRVRVRPWPAPGWTAALLAGLAAFALWQLLAEGPVHPLRRAAAEALAAPLPAPVLDRAGVADALVRLGSCAALAWLAAQSWAHRSVRPALGALAAVAALAAVYALLAHVLGWNTVLWLPGQAYPAATGPFVARGGFAAYTGLAMLAAAALWLSRGADAPAWTAWLPALAWPLLAAALLASQSRAGLAATVAAHALVLLLAARRGRVSARAAVALLTGGAALLGLGAAVAGVDVRLAQLPRDLSHRLEIWQAALAAIAERPWTGHGLGSFPALFELYRPPAAPRSALSAHSGLLEWMAEAGVPATLAWLAALAGLTAACLGAPRDSAAPLAAVPGMALLALQGAVDFASQVPGVAFTAALLLGLGLAHGRSGRHRARVRRR